MVYNIEIECPCGCRNYLPGSQSDFEEEYNGGGFLYENYEERYYCEYAEDYCSSHGYDCEDCPCWKNAHPICDIDVDDEYECPTPDQYYVDDGLMQSCSRCCSECPRWKEHFPEGRESDEEDNANIASLETVAIHNPQADISTITTTALESRYTIASAPPLFYTDDSVHYTIQNNSNGLIQYSDGGNDWLTSTITRLDIN